MTIARRRAFAALAIVGLVASGCSLLGSFLEIYNETDQTLYVFRENPISGLRAGSGQATSGGSWQFRGECIEADLVIEDADGNELVRRPGPFCTGDSPWVITEEMLNSPVGGR